MKDKVLILTSSFPRWKEDSIFGGGNFVPRLAKEIQGKFEFFITAPLANGSQEKENLDGLNVFRYKQGLFFNPQLSYGSGLISNVKNKLILLLFLPLFFLSQLFHMKKIIKENQIRLIHAYWFIPGGLVAVIYKILFDSKIKIVITALGSDIFGFKGKLFKSLLKFILRKTNVVTVVGTGLKDAIESFNETKVPVHIYPLGVEVDLFETKSGISSFPTALDPESLNILYCGVMVEQKGIRYLLNAFLNVSDKFPKAKLYFAGDGVLKPELEKIVTENNKNNKVQFLGAINHSQIHTLYQQSEIFVLPSEWEGLGLVILEALSSKCLVIASDIPSVKFIDPEENIIFRSKVKSESSLQNRLEEILSNIESKEIQNRKVLGRELVLERFDWKVVGKNYSNLFIQLLNENK